MDLSSPDRTRELSRSIPTHFAPDRPTPAALVSGEVSADEAPHPLSVFDMFRVGIGPSSSHTVGPMRAGLAFTAELASVPTPTRITVDLFGSLGATGRGHNTDRAVLLGLAGHDPETVSVDTVEAILPSLARTKTLDLPGGRSVPMDFDRDVRFRPLTILPYHVNALTITAWAPPTPAQVPPVQVPGDETMNVLDNAGETAPGIAPTSLPSHVTPGSPERLGEEANSSSLMILRRTYYSVGGGFVMVQHNDDPQDPQVGSLATGQTNASIDAAAPYPFSSAEQLLAVCEESGLSIAQVVRANEEAVRPPAAVDSYLDRIADTMFDAIDQGTSAQGILPGGLDVPRRAKTLVYRLAGRTHSSQSTSSQTAGTAAEGSPITRWASMPNDPMRAIDWVNVFALAVNEENAAGHRIVTAPTNGAAGVIPAVLGYLVSFCPEAGCSPSLSVPNMDDGGVMPFKGMRLRASDDSGPSSSGGAPACADGTLSALSETQMRGSFLRRRAIHEFLLAATAIGALIKTNASIAGAEVGCQGEVGSASAMAAAGLAQALGGTPQQVENAAEIAMEHSLGLTCDPVSGLVQIPCIERNAIAAVQAINAARMALWGDGRHTVALDVVIETMRQTGNDMLSKYKETSAGGLAVNVVEC
ncbi:L-serine ammonia-lyase, iron-sulfur-dependent, subunit alpha [Schaalia sp. ZJ405]|uniref:L-serine ammonia-lyase, iron-sulfur-dependent, subunit alpha n=1 Tax=Schaalia sp. ZJ405 TaxID=2709403 RepID=UPI001E518EE4|nr:L-serine ammonia-lyase, iron-sulfur-dependent, subunit alpha [Schaalia sp. ZJ405]